MTRADDRLITMTAETGNFVDVDGVPTLILQNGERSEGNNKGQTGAVLFLRAILCQSHKKITSQPNVSRLI